LDVLYDMRYHATTVGTTENSESRVNGKFYIAA